MRTAGPQCMVPMTLPLLGLEAAPSTIQTPGTVGPTASTTTPGRRIGLPMLNTLRQNTLRLLDLEGPLLQVDTEDDRAEGKNNCEYWSGSRSFIVACF